MLLHLPVLLLSVVLAQDASRTDMDEADVRNWTPDINAQWGNPEWRRFGDAKIRDDRFMHTDYGPVYGATIVIRDDDFREITRAHKGLGIRLGGHGDAPEAMLVYDRNLLQCQGGWIGGYLRHSDERFGLMDIPGNPVDHTFVHQPTQAWRVDGDDPAERESWCFPLPEDVGRFTAVHLRGDDVILDYKVAGDRVLEWPTMARIDGEWVLLRHFQIGAGPQTYRLALPDDDVTLIGPIKRDGTDAVIPASKTPRRFVIVHAKVRGAPTPANLHAKLKGPSTARWPDTLPSSIEQVGASGPYVHERIAPPFENPWQSLMFLGGLGFMPDGDIVVSTLFGDVWMVSDVDTDTPQWRRIATGLYQPLGIKVVDDRIFVIERGQLTELIDHNGDGEADEYRNINNRWHTPGDAHCYDINLETDPDGNWYFVKNGGWHTPTGGCILKIPADGRGDAEVYATGFRHCNSMGMSPTGQLATGGQQGTWQPATRLDLNREGGFYGLIDAAHDDDIEMYDRPLLWMPLACDNSAGDPVFAPEHWGPLGGELLHLSWGQCWLLHILQEQVNGMPQGAAVVLPLGRMMAGPARGAFSPVDGHLWIAGCMGWQTWGPWDGSLDRIRHVDGDDTLPTPTAIRTTHDGVQLTFERPLDSVSATDPANWSVRQWNYHWHDGYGSAHWSPRRWMDEGEDQLEISSIRIDRDNTRVSLTLHDWRPAMQTRIGWSFRDAEGDPVDGVTWATTHRTAITRGSFDRAAAQRTAIANADIDLHWEGPAHDCEVLLRAVPTEAGDPEGIGIPIDVDAAGPHHMRIEMRDRRITATLDGEVVFEHFETDTRVPAAGTVHVLGDIELNRFRAQPVAHRPQGRREPRTSTPGR